MDEMDVRDLRARVERDIRRLDLIPPGGEVTCLVSGGADSTCLWDALRGARLPRVGAPREPRAPRRGVRRGRALLSRGARRGGGRRAARRARRTSCARSGTATRRTGCRATGPHCLGPGRDRPLPARLERPCRHRDQAEARGRRGATAARPLARGDRGVLRLGGSRIPRGQLESRHETRPDPRPDPAAARGARPPGAREPARARNGGRAAASAADARAHAPRAARERGRHEGGRPRLAASVPSASTTE